VYYENPQKLTESAQNKIKNCLYNIGYLVCIKEQNYKQESRAVAGKLRDASVKISQYDIDTQYAVHRCC